MLKYVICNKCGKICVRKFIGGFGFICDWLKDLYVYFDWLEYMYKLNFEIGNICFVFFINVDLYNNFYY